MCRLCYRGVVWYCPQCGFEQTAASNWNHTDQEISYSTKWFISRVRTLSLWWFSFKKTVIRL